MSCTRRRSGPVHIVNNISLKSRAKTYPIGDGAGHAGNEHHAAAVAKLDHLLRNRLSSHEDTGNVDLEHAVGVLSLVLERWRFLLDARSRDQTVHPSLNVRDFLDRLVEAFNIPHVNLSVFELRAQFILCLLCDNFEVRMRLRQYVQGVHYMRSQLLNFLHLQSSTDQLRRLPTMLQPVLSRVRELHQKQARLCSSD